MMTNTVIEFLDQIMPTPLVLASGIWGTTASLMERAARAGCGAVTAKSCGPVPRAGHVNPSCVAWEHGLINAIGLANPGAEAEVELLAATKQALSPLGVPLIASIFAGTPAEFGRVAATVAQAQPDMIEVNISCPNVGSEFGEPFAANPQDASDVTAHVKAALKARAFPSSSNWPPTCPAWRASPAPWSTPGPTRSARSTPCPA